MNIYPKTITIILIIYNPQNYKKNISNISKYTDITYTHVKKILSQLKDGGFIKIETIGRDRIVKSTAEGIVLFSLLNKVNDIINKK